jgi:hypothetical protein
VRTGLAFARPIPLDAPVTSAVLFWSEVIVISLAFQITDKTGTEPLGRRLSIRSTVQKQSRVFNEELRVHVVRAVIGVGVDDHLCAAPHYLGRPRTHTSGPDR